MSGMLRSPKTRQTRARHRKANRDRDARFELVSVGDIDDDFDMLRRVEEFHHQGHYGDLDENEQPNRLFEPRLQSLDDVPLGILSHKEEPLPVHLVPETKDDLLRFCRGLITRRPDDHLVALVTRGWVAAPDRELESHVRHLWAIRAYDHDTYRFLVCGQHHSARLRAFYQGIPENWSTLDFERTLVRMALLWCAHDVQLTFARNSRLVKNPFGNVTPFESPTTLSSFLDSSYCVLTPSTVVETARPRYESLLEVLTMRNRQEKEQARFLKRRASKDISFRRAYNQARWIYARTDREMLVGLVDAQIGRVPGLIEDFKQQNPFWRHLAGDVPRRPVPTFAHLCFSGLTVLQANAVAILRFCQVERQLERLVQEGLTPRKGKKPRQLTSIPAYRKLDKASMTRARNLLHAYRRGYPDKDFDSVSKGSDGVLESGEMRDLRGIGQTALDRAETFLCGLGRRRLGDNHGPLESVRRTFYLLDVIPDIRLCR